MRARAFVVPSVAVVAILAVPAIGIAIAAQANPQPVPHSTVFITYHGRTFDPGNMNDVQQYNQELKTQFPPCSDDPHPTFTGTPTGAATGPVTISICMRSTPFTMPSGPPVVIGSTGTDRQ